ncbi:bifunctional nuclease family protein [bacterium]|nr:bifunctional nuclease family protein [bacterium]
MRFVEMNVGGLAVDQTVTQPFFVLKDDEKQRSFPVSIAENTASVATPAGIFMQGENPYASLLTTLIEQGKMSVDEIQIMENSQGKLEGIILISGVKDSDVRLTTSPGEAVVMAVLYGLSIFLEDALLMKSSYFRSKSILSSPDKLLDSLLPRSILEMQGSETSSKSKKDKVQ